MSAVESPVQADLDAIRAAGGQRIQGPAAITGDWRRAMHLTWTLAYSEWRLKFFGSVLGYFWQLGRPLLMFGIYFVIFTKFVDLSGDAPYYAPTLLASIMLYQFFSEVTGASVGAVVNRENLVRKIHFPRIVIPLSVVLQATFNLALNIIVVGIFMALAGVPVRLGWLWMIPLFGFLLIFVTGLSMLLSALFVRFRDVQPIWDVVTLALFYATPILYPLERVDVAWGRDLIMLNPLAVVVQQMRHSVFDPGAPGAAAAAGAPWHLLLPIGLALSVFIVGFWVFNRTAPSVAEDL
jgi:ABC-2 type transport system permease protein